MRISSLYFFLPVFFIIQVQPDSLLKSKPAFATYQVPNSANSNKLIDTIPRLRFSNYTWYIKSGAFTPGPNIWNSKNAFVDSIGRLHLMITYNQMNQKWECAEIWTTESLGFGTYEWYVEAAVDVLDKNIVFGLFNYPDSSNMLDGTNEIDIEYAKWGIEKNKIGNYTVWPSFLIPGFTNQSSSFNITLSQNKTVQQFRWYPNKIIFQSFKNWNKDKKYLVFKKNYRPKNAMLYIPQSPLRIHINLWLFKGLPPSNNQPVEIIIQSFKKSND